VLGAEFRLEGGSKCSLFSRRNLRSKGTRQQIMVMGQAGLKNDYSSKI